MQTGGTILVNKWEEFKLHSNFFQLHIWDAFVNSYDGWWRSSSLAKLHGNGYPHWNPDFLLKCNKNLF